MGPRPRLAASAKVVDLSTARDRLNAPDSLRTPDRADERAVPPAGAADRSSDLSSDLSSKATQFEAFLTTVGAYLKPADVERISAAYAFSDSAQSDGCFLPARATRFRSFLLILFES